VTAPIRLGIVGCGGVVQIIHLPALAQLPEQFRVAALCDASRTVVDGVGERWNIAARCTDHRDLLALRDVDAVLIANPHANHAEVALAAMEAGKHVLIEKPMCMTLADADRLIAMQARKRVVAQVGYMRRYAPAFTQAATLLTDQSEFRYARVQDMIGSNALIMDSTSRVIRGDDIAPEFVAAGKKLQDEMIEAAIGRASSELNTAYILLLALASHDLSAMRELIGMPKRVLFAAHRWGGRYITAAFDYGHFVCQFASGVDRIGRMDAFLEFHTGGRVVRVEYDTPFVRNLPARLVVTEPNDVVGVTQSAGFSTRQDAFVIEWQAFHDNVTHGKTPKTSLADSRDDLVLFKDMIEQMR
jgi:predicted dehydrogenase